MVDKGFTDQLKGKTKEIVGDLTGDTVTKAEGWLEQGVGKTKRRLRFHTVPLPYGSQIIPHFAFEALPVTGNSRAVRTDSTYGG